MNVGIIGFPQAGKKTLFRLLVGDEALSGHADPRKPLRGVAEVEDSRFDRLLEMVRPRKETRARLEFVLLPKIEGHAVSEGGLFKEMGEIDAFCHVVRAFADASIYHVWGSPDPVREVETVHAELVLHDLLFIEKRLERIESNLKKVKDERQAREKVVLERFREQLEAEHPLRELEVSVEERAVVASYPLLTLRPMILALNVSDDQIADDALFGDFRARAGERTAAAVIRIAAAAEAEIARLETVEERRQFMAEMGIDDTALHVLTRACIDALGYGSFFTVGEKEVRQWFFRRGLSAPEVAGVIHSDMERGFIRAEVMKYDDLVALGSEEAVKSAGKYYVKGKDYTVEDGDILFIRFNV